MSNNIKYQVVHPNIDKSKEQLIQLCLDELNEVGLPFPRNMQPREKRTLLRTEGMKVSLMCEAANTYRFFYRSIVNGSGTKFTSALFKVEVL